MNPINKELCFICKTSTTKYCKCLFETIGGRQYRALSTRYLWRLVVGFFFCFFLPTSN